MKNSIFMDWFGGLPLDTWIPMGSSGFSEGPALILYGRWLLIIGSFLLVTGYCREKRDSLEGLARYRYGTVFRWWRLRFWKGLLSGIQEAVCVMLIFLVCDLLTGRAPFLFAVAGDAVKTGGLWLVHVIGLDALFLLLDLGNRKRCVPAAVLLLEGVSFYLGYRINAISNFMYGSWGMYQRSAWFDTRGFQPVPVLIAELLLLAAAYCAGKLYLKRAGCVRAQKHKSAEA